MSATARAKIERGGVAAQACNQFCQSSLASSPFAPTSLAAIQWALSSDFAPLKSTRIALAKEKSASESSVPLKLAPSRLASESFAPLKSAPDRSAPTSVAPRKSAPLKSAPLSSLLPEKSLPLKSWPDKSKTKSPSTSSISSSGKYLSKYLRTLSALLVKKVLRCPFPPGDSTLPTHLRSSNGHPTKSTKNPAIKSLMSARLQSGISSKLLAQNSSEAALATHHSKMD